MRRVKQSSLFASQGHRTTGLTVLWLIFAPVVPVDRPLCAPSERQEVSEELLHVPLPHCLPKDFLVKIVGR
jgi:hypothetical protein